MELTAEHIKARFTALLGSVPIIHVWEGRDTLYPEGYDYGDYYNGHLDIEKLDLIDSGSLRYISGFFTDIFRSLEREPSRVHISTSASRKYSFGDTPDWWADIACAPDPTRTTITLDIDVHS